MCTRQLFKGLHTLDFLYVHLLLVCLCSKSEYAAFDPLFWLLHASVDRCIWLFQNNNYDGAGWKEPGEAAGARGESAVSGSEHCLVPLGNLQPTGMAPGSAAEQATKTDGLWLPLSCYLGWDGAAWLSQWLQVHTYSQQSDGKH
jgi:hypothetical protein